jgi:hypothetical protein
VTAVAERPVVGAARAILTARAALTATPAEYERRAVEFIDRALPGR